MFNYIPKKGVPNYIYFDKEYLEPLLNTLEGNIVLSIDFLSKEYIVNKK